MDGKQPWIFPFLVGALIAVIVCKWSTINALYDNRNTLSGLSKVSEGFKELAQ